MFKKSLLQLISELEKNEALKDEVSILKKLAEDPKDPADNYKEMGPAKDDLYTNKAPVHGADIKTENIEPVSPMFKLNDRVKLVKPIVEFPMVPVGTVGTIISFEVPQDGMIGVEWEQKFGYFNMNPDEIELIKIVKDNVEAALDKKAAEDYTDEDRTALKETVKEFYNIDLDTKQIDILSDYLYKVEEGYEKNDILFSDFDWKYNIEEWLKENNLSHEIKGSLDLAADSEEKKIANIFKTNPKKLDLFNDLVKGSLALNEISKEDVLEWDNAMAVTKMKPEDLESWTKLAEISLRMFKKTRQAKEQ